MGAGSGLGHAKVNEENTQKLIEDFPRLYRGRECGLMPYGFECGDGWFGLIQKLSFDIEQATRNAGLNSSSEQWPRATQVKEKWGTLRFHFHIRSPGENDLDPVHTLMPTGIIEPRLAICIETLRELISKALEESAGICERCGLAHNAYDCALPETNQEKT